MLTNSISTFVRKIEMRCGKRDAGSGVVHYPIAKRYKMKRILFLILIFPLLFLTSCNKSTVGGAAVGAGAAGAAYEYQNKKALEDLDEDYRAGRITREEYERRKDEIQKRSLVY